MRNYGSNHEIRGIRDWPDKADCSALGLPSRFHRQRSASKRSARRFYKKAERKSAQAEIARILSHDCNQ